jgi:hypothetical protein
MNRDMTDDGPHPTEPPVDPAVGPPKRKRNWMPMIVLAWWSSPAA